MSRIWRLSGLGNALGAIMAFGQCAALCGLSGAFLVLAASLERAAIRPSALVRLCACALVRLAESAAAALVLEALSHRRSGVTFGAFMALSMDSAL